MTDRNTSDCVPSEIAATNESISVLTAEHPFDVPLLFECPAGETVAALVSRFGPAWESDEIVVTIDGRRVEAEVWIETLTQPGQQIAISNALGNDGVLKVFAQIAVLAAATAASVLLPGAGVFGAAWANSLFGAAVAGGIPLAGRFEIDALGRTA